MAPRHRKKPGPELGPLDVNDDDHDDGQDDHDDVDGEDDHDDPRGVERPYLSGARPCTASPATTAPTWTNCAPAKNGQSICVHRTRTWATRRGDHLSYNYANAAKSGGGVIPNLSPRLLSFRGEGCGRGGLSDLQTARRYRR
jgi:hypothetical protein